MDVSFRQERVKTNRFIKSVSVVSKEIIFANTERNKRKWYENVE